MKRKNIYFLFALVIMLTFVVIPGCSEGSKSATESIPEISSPDDNLGESIAVHGDWTIEVRNADGTLVERRDFENTIASTGDNALAEILTRQWSVGGWTIAAGNYTIEDNPFFDVSNPTVNTFCAIVEPGGPASLPFQFDNLTIGTGAGGEQVVLSGSAIAQRDGSINGVLTLVARVDKTLPPAIDYAAGSWFFTEKNLGTTFPVSEGQLILFTVVISFS
ncbi:MAG: hypothetical protein ACYSRQ_06460 [Planctomycetota bacterium]